MTWLQEVILAALVLVAPLPRTEPPHEPSPAMSKEEREIDARLKKALYEFAYEKSKQYKCRFLLVHKFEGHTYTSVYAIEKITFEKDGWISFEKAYIVHTDDEKGKDERTSWEPKQEPPSMRLRWRLKFDRDVKSISAIKKARMIRGEMSLTTRGDKK